MNAKMKLLSLALVGLCGYAGSAMACPTGPTTAEGGAWTSKTQLPDAASSPLAVVAGGLDTSACKLTSALAAGSTAASAFVRYNNAASEPSYRFQFLVDTTNLNAFNSTDSAVVFQAPATTTAHALNRLLRVSLVAGPAGAKRVRFIASCGTGSFTCAKTYAVDLIAGVNRIEGNLQIGATAAGSLKVWINAAAGTTEPAVSDSIANLDNGAWGGVSAASLGLTAPTQGFADFHGGQVVGFDTFDSRRQTYIGH